MPEVLTSVRFDRHTVEQLRVLADLNDSSVAAEVRSAVDRYLERELQGQNLESKMANAGARLRERVSAVATNSE